MFSEETLKRVRSFAEEIANREGCLLYDLEFHDGPGRVLRVYIDKDQGGVSLEDCVNVSRGLNLRLDVEDVIAGGRYELEVSSPGLERKLTQPWHFAKSVGSTVNISYMDDGGQARSAIAKLMEVDGTQLRLENEKGPLLVELMRVKKARTKLMQKAANKPTSAKKKR